MDDLESYSDDDIIKNKTGFAYCKYIMVSYQIGWVQKIFSVLKFQISKWYWVDYANGLVQDCSNSIALAMELLQFCTKTSMWHGQGLTHEQLEMHGCIISTVAN